MAFDEMADDPAVLDDVGHGMERAAIYQADDVTQVRYSDGRHDLSVFHQPGEVDWDEMPDTGEMAMMDDGPVWMSTMAGLDVLVTERGEDVLVVKPAIINLDVTAPDKLSTGMSRTYAESSGEMTLYVELYDSVTGDLIAKALDRKVDRNRGYYTWTNSVTNKAAADRILKGWAEILLSALNEAKAQNTSD